MPRQFECTEICALVWIYPKIPKGFPTVHSGASLQPAAPSPIPNATIMGRAPHHHCVGTDGNPALCGPGHDSCDDLRQTVHCHR